MSERTPRVVVDSSVAVKWFVQEGEVGVDEAWALLRQHLSGDVELACPSLLRLEVLNALLRRGASAESLDEAATVLSDLHLEWHEIDSDLSRAAARIAAEHALTLYDAAFAALARALDAALVTADAKLAASEACETRELSALGW